MHRHHGQMRRKVDTGPWQPVEQWAVNWAKYLQSTGLYDAVEIESKGQRRSISEPSGGRGFVV